MFFLVLGGVVDRRQLRGCVMRADLEPWSRSTPAQPLRSDQAHSCFGCTLLQSVQTANGGFAAKRIKHWAECQSFGGLSLIQAPVILSIHLHRFLPPGGRASAMSPGRPQHYSCSLFLPVDICTGESTDVWCLAGSGTYLSPLPFYREAHLRSCLTPYENRCLSARSEADSNRFPIWHPR